ncbi:BatA domain-containing protein [bacterium]
MLGFINTSVLIGLIGVSIPLLIHLLARQKVKKVYFSSIVFLKQIQKQHFKRMQIRQILLLLLRCLSILFIVLAFARPTFKAGSLFQGKSKASVVIAMDHSMSMARGDVWFEAQSVANQVVEMLDVADQAAIIGNSNNNPSLMLVQKRNLLNKILKASPQYTHPSLESLLRVSDEIMSSNEINREVYFVTDLQATAFSDTTEDHAQFPNIDHLYIIPVQEEVPNTALVDGGIENQILAPGCSLRIFAQVYNYSDQPVEAALVRLFLNNTAVAQKVVALPSQGSKKVVFSVTPRESGWITGEIELEGDSFLQDNQFYFTSFIPSKIRVLILGNQQQDIMPIRLALAPQQSRSDFEIFESLVGLDWTGMINQIDVVFINNCPTFTELEVQTVKRFVNNGGGVIVIPGPATNLRQVNDQLIHSMNVTLGNIVNSQEAGSYRSLGRIDFAHPLFEQVFKTGHEQFRTPQFYQSINMVDAGDSQILMRFKDEQPFLLARQGEYGNVILLTSGIGPPWSDFQTTPIFAPLIHRMTLYTAGSYKHLERQICGQPVQFFLGSVPNENDRYYVQLPSNEEREVLPEITGRKMQLSLKTTEQPGLYQFFQNDSLLTVHAVNLDPSESDFKPLNPKILKSKFIDLPISIISQKGSFATAIRKARWGREIGWEMLLIALILLAAEMGLARVRTKN